MTARSGRPDPEGHHDDLDPQDAARLTLLVPDDASELDPDRLVWLAEDTGAGRVDRRPLPGHRVDDVDRPSWARRRRRRLAAVAGVTACAVLVMSALGATLALFSPSAPAPGPGTALRVTDVSPGHLEGLLPAVTLAGDNGSLASTDLRPAVVAVVPTTCPDCSRRLSSVAGQAAEYGLLLALVGGPTQHQQLQDLAGSLAGRQVVTLLDRNQTLRSTFVATGAGTSGLMLLLVRSDGTLYNVVDDPAADARLEPALVQLNTPATSA